MLTRLKDVPIGSIIYDPSWEWEHKTEENYSGNGEIKPVEWIVVAKNHYDNPNNSVTVISNELIGKYTFANKNDSNYRDSDIRIWLNDMFYSSFSIDFKNLVLTTKVPNVAYGDNSYITDDKVFLPSQTELGGGSSYTYDIGKDWGYFRNDSSRIARINGNIWRYWTRSPYSGNSSNVHYVYSDGGLGDYDAYIRFLGVRPALNLKSDILVKSIGKNKYEIVYNYKKTSLKTKTDIIMVFGVLVTALNTQKLGEIKLTSNDEIIAETISSLQNLFKTETDKDILMQNIEIYLAKIYIYAKETYTEEELNINECPLTTSELELIYKLCN